MTEASHIEAVIEPTLAPVSVQHRAGPWLGWSRFRLLGVLAALLAGLGLVLEPLTELGFAYRLTHGVGQGAAIALFLILAAAIGRYIVSRSAAQNLTGPRQSDLQQASAIVAQQDDAAAHLVGLADKHILFSDCGQAFVMYGRRGRTWIVLSDPVGARAAWPALVTKFVRAAKAEGCRVAFYQVSQAFLPTAVDTGFRLFKLGDQAVLDLTTFDLKGGDWLKLRRSINRAERDGLEFAVLPASAVPAFMDELGAVSDRWLAHHNAAEKGFSLGTFQRGYVASHPVAVIRLEGRIVAFANILTTETRTTAFIDLMRHLPGVHRGAMDLLFVRIIQHLQAEGYLKLNLGMAPLSGLSNRACAPLWHRLGRFVFENGERFYNFKGVQAFKAKFDPDWQPRYLAVYDKRQMPETMIDIVLLIGGGLRGLLRR